MDYFNKLPNEIVFIIFKKLNLSDLFNLRIVNKRFKKISEESVNDLIVSDDPSYGNFWFLTDNLKSPSRCDRIVSKNFSSFEIVFNLEFSLKRLYYNLSTCDDYDFNFLEKFEQLDHLELNFHNSRNRIVLNLPKLTTLLIDIANHKELKLIIESKKLQTLCINQFNEHSIKIEVACSEKIKHLKLNLYDGFRIEQFQNLEHLSYRKDKLDREILSKLKKLKVLEYDGHFSNRSDLSAIEYIFEQRLVLRRTDLVIRLNGVEIENTNQLVEIKTLSEDGFRLKYYHLLTGYLYHESNLEGDYGLIQCFNDSIPQTIYSKFFNLNQIEFYLQDKEFCCSIISNLPYLKTLSLIHTELSQSFYDALTNCKYLEVLTINLVRELFNDKRFRDQPDEPINFDFVTKFRELTYFSVDFEFQDPYDVAVRAFNQSKYLKKFEFIDKRNISYRITKPGNTYSIKVYKDIYEYPDSEDEGSYKGELNLFFSFGLKERDFVNLQNKIDAIIKKKGF